MRRSPAWTPSFANSSHAEPVFCIHPAELRAAARRFRAFPGRVLYAVKCNPHPAVLETLFEEGITDFDVASLDEIKLIDDLFGGRAGQYFNNPAKTRPAIRTASKDHQIRFYTVDCEGGDRQDPRRSRARQRPDHRRAASDPIR